MLRILAMVAAASLVLPATGTAGGAGGPPYKLDAKGKCHDSAGKSVNRSLCAATAAGAQCKDPTTGQPAKCPPAAKNEPSWPESN
jgi:hypothetical protein